jgi:hypothetical protein
MLSMQTLNVEEFASLEYNLCARLNLRVWCHSITNNKSGRVCNLCARGIYLVSE